MSSWLDAMPTGVRFAAMASSAFLVIMMLMGIVGSREFNASLRAGTDDRITNVALAQVEAVAGVEADSGLEARLLANLELTPADGLSVSGLETQILAQDGTVLAATPGLRGVRGLVSGRSLVRVAAGVPVYGEVAVDDETLRYVGSAVGDDSGRIVAIAIPITTLAEAERALLALFGPLALAGSVLIGLVGIWISRRMLEPLVRMSSEAEGIGAYDLSQRLPVPTRRDEIRRLGSTLNRMLERLDAAVQRERNFTSEASHELRTPLAILRAEVELARAAAAEPAALAGLDSALEEIDRITAVVEDLLLLARADVGVALDRRQVVDLGTLASDTVRRFSTVAAARNVTVVASGTANINGDPHALERVLANLLDNALRHTPPGGVVNITVEPGPRGATLSIRDTGSGADPASLATLFDRYSRAVSRPGSAGLGLSIVAAVAASHGGSVSACNLAEGGLEIRVELGGGT